MKHPTKRFAFSGLAIAAMGAIFLFGGTGTTAYAYQNSLPGDTLYPVKTSFEQTQVLLSGDAANRSALHLQFADRRMSEIALLAQSGRFSAVSVTAHHYALSMASAASEAHLLAKSNPAQSAVLTQKIASELARNSRMLSDVKNGVPDAVKVEIEDAVHAADQGVKSAGDDAGEMENTPIPTMKSTIGVTMTPGVEDNNEKEKEKEKEDEKEGNHGKKTATPAPTMTATQMENTATMMPTETPTQMENTATMMPTETPTQMENTATMMPTETPTQMENTATMMPTMTATQMENTATMMPTETPTQMENTATMMPTETPIPTVGVSSNQGNGGSAHDKGGNGNDKGGGHH